MTTVVDVDALTGELDRLFDSWDVWRRMGGGFCVKVSSGGRDKTASNTSLVAALTEASKFAFLPLVPARPIMVDLHVEKVGRQWHVLTDSGQMAARFGTKKAAVAAIDRSGERVEKAIQEWDREHGWSVDKVEGVDFETGRR